MSYLRLTRKKGDDFLAFFDYINEGKTLGKQGKYTILERAALAVICNDKWVPETQEGQQSFIDYAWAQIDNSTAQQ
jgi:hypothetical protein